MRNRFVLIVFILALFITGFYYYRINALAQQATQAYLFGGPDIRRVTADIDHPITATDPFSTTNWMSPVDWTTATIIMRVDVESRKSNMTMQLMVCMTRGPERAPTEEICSPHMLSMLGTAPPWYVKLTPLKDWTNVTGNWTWDKPIDGIYVHVRDAQGNFLITQNCWPQRCYTGTLDLTQHLPITVFAAAIMYVPGTTVQAPWIWRSCPANLCTGWQIEEAPPGVSPPFPTAQPSTHPGQCLSKALGDANCDDTIGLVDYNFWKREFKGQLTTKTGDFNNSGTVTLADYQIWKKSFMTPGIN